MTCSKCVRHTYVLFDESSNEILQRKFTAPEPVAIGDKLRPDGSDVYLVVEKCFDLGHIRLRVKNETAATAEKLADAIFGVRDG